jgi:hypothetical protein
MIEASCHCRAVRIAVSHAPETVTDCNCSICRRLGVLWAYYPPSDVRLLTPEDAMQSYVRADARGDLAFRRCGACGCIVDWRPLPGRDPGRMGVNARLFPPEVMDAARVRHFDGAASPPRRDD